MAGIMQDNILFPILDLIRREIRQNDLTEAVRAVGDPFGGVPSAEILRENVADSVKMTGASLTYESGFRVDIYMFFDDLIEWKLMQVTLVTLNPDGVSIVTYSIGLNYNEDGLLLGTTINRL